MAGTFLGKYDTTAANNTATGTGSVSVAEGMLPSNINNAFRSVMADIRQHYNTAEWIEYGDAAGTYTATYASSTSFTIDGANVTAIYHAGRRVKVTASTPGTIYGTVSSTSFSTNTTVNVTWDSGSLSSEAITSVYIGVLAKTNNSIPTEVIGTTNIADDAITAAKMAANSVDSDSYVDGSIDLAHMSINSIDSDQYVDASIDTAHLAADVITGAKIADDAIDSEHITDGSIDTAHIAADQITNAKIADDQIDSEHYVDGSIDTAHIADNQITLAKLAGGTDGNIISYDASGDPVAIATGSDGQVLTSTGAGSPPAFEAAAGGMNALISTTTASDDATISITGMDSTYKIYTITLNAIIGANDGVTLYAAPIIGGAVKTDAYHPYGQMARNSAAGELGNESADSTYWKMSVSDSGNATGEHFNGEIKIYDPSNTSEMKMITWTTATNLANASVTITTGGGQYSNGTAAMTGINFRFASGNITSGVFKLWGTE